METAANGCPCVCNVQLDNKKDGGTAGFWQFWDGNCGCACDKDITDNRRRNEESAYKIGK